MRVVLDTSILVRAHEGATGPARELLLRIVESDHVLVISDEILHELARVLRYPRMIALHGLSEGRIYDYWLCCGWHPKLYAQIRCSFAVRDVNDTT